MSREHHIYGEFVRQGQIVRFFSDNWGDRDPAERWVENEYQYYVAEMENLELARQTNFWDPNRCDPRNVRKELGDRNVVNLGMRVNKVGSRRRRF